MGIVDNKTKNNFNCSCFGGGKTTITERLKHKFKKLKSSIFLIVIHLITLLLIFVNGLMMGANYDEWVLTPLIHDIEQHIQNNTLDYIIIDYPFAYLNSEMRKFIDVTIFIDTPLDIAMARRIFARFLRKVQ